jgi:hypothetical protein
MFALSANVGMIVTMNTNRNIIDNATTIVVCFIFIFGASSIVCSQENATQYRLFKPFVFCFWRGVIIIHER